MIRRSTSFLLLVNKAMDARLVTMQKKARHRSRVVSVFFVSGVFFDTDWFGTAAFGCFPGSLLRLLLRPPVAARVATRINAFAVLR